MGLLWGHFATTQRRAVFKRRAAAKKRRRRQAALQAGVVSFKIQRLRALRMGLCRRTRVFIDASTEAQLRGVGSLR